MGTLHGKSESHACRQLHHVAVLGQPRSFAELHLELVRVQASVLRTCNCRTANLNQNCALVLRAARRFSDGYHPNTKRYAPRRTRQMLFLLLSCINVRCLTNNFGTDTVQFWPTAAHSYPYK